MRNKNYSYKSRSWQFIKSKSTAGLSIDYKQSKNKIRVFVIDGDTAFFINLFSPAHRKVLGASLTNDADYQEFLTTYKPLIDNIPPSAVNNVKLANIAVDGNKLTIHESSRPSKNNRNLATVWTGTGDDLINHVIASGPPLILDILATDTVKSVEAEFDPLFGEVWLHEGYLMWTNAGWGDTVTNSVFSRPTKLQTLTALDYEIINHKIKIATLGPGTGTHGFAGTPVLVPNRTNTGYWNYTTTLTPNTTQTGAYDIYDIEMEVSRFHNKIPLFGTAANFNMLQSADTDILPPGYFIRITATNVSGNAWKVWFIMTIYRQQTL